VLLAVKVAIVIAGFYYVRLVTPFESTDKAFIAGRVAPLASQVPDRVAELPVTDQQAFNVGDALLNTDPLDEEATLAQARAELAAARRRLDQSTAQVEASRTKVAQAQAAVVAADVENQRAAEVCKLYESVDSGAISRSEMDAARSQAQAASANLEAARSQARAAEAELASNEALVEAASVAVQQAEAKLSDAPITEREDVRVMHSVVDNGAYIQPGQVLLANEPRRYWIIATFKEKQVNRMRVGQPVEVVVDAYPGRTFEGHVESIPSDSAARFSLLPPENATSNRIIVPQRVPVKIVLNVTPGTELALGPGMSVVAKVRVN
jgi:membrane fusion protein (multidrug efflux system)